VTKNSAAILNQNKIRLTIRSGDETRQLPSHGRSALHSDHYTYGLTATSPG